MVVLAAGPRRPIVVVAGEVCTQADSVVGDSAVVDRVAADSVVAVGVKFEPGEMDLEECVCHV